MNFSFRLLAALRPRGFSTRRKSRRFIRDAGNAALLTFFRTPRKRAFAAGMTFAVLGLSPQFLYAQGNQGGFGPGTGGSGGATPAGSTGAPQINNGGGTLGAQQNTIVVNGGAGGLSGTSGFGTTANTRYFVSANDTETAQLTITAANVTVECVPGVTIQQTTASTDLFVFGAGANNFTARNCGTSMPASGTCGRMFGDTPATPVNNIVLDNVELNANSSTCTNGGKGWVNISGGSGHRFNVWDPFSNENIIKADNQTPSTHNPISDVRFRNDFGPLITNADGIAPFNALINASNTQSYYDIDITAQVASYCIWFQGNSSVDHPTLKGRCKLTANTAASGLVKTQITEGAVGPMVLDDGGKTGAGFHELYVSDGYNNEFGDITIHATGATQVPILVADMHGSKFHDITVSGDQNLVTGQVATNGWSTSQPCMSLGVDAADSATDNTIEVTCYMPPSSTADGIDLTCTAASAVCDGNVIGPKTKLVGNSTTGIGISITNSAGTSAANDRITGPAIKGFSTGISIGSNVSGTQVDGALITGATTPVSDSGTNSRILTHEVQATVTLASGSASVTFSGNDVWTSGTTYICNGSDQTTPANAVSFTYTSGTALTVTGTGTDVIRYRCRGY